MASVISGNHTFPITTPKEAQFPAGREVFRVDNTKLKIPEQIAALSKILTRTYDKGYMRYLVASNIPLFLINKQHIKD